MNPSPPLPPLSSLSWAETGHPAPETSDFLRVTDKGMRFKVHLSDIIRLEGTQSYTWIVLQDGRKFLNSVTLKVYEMQLQQQGFLRVHKKHMVNTRHISKLMEVDLTRNGVKKTCGLRLTNNEFIEWSRRRSKNQLTLAMLKTLLPETPYHYVYPS